MYPKLYWATFKNSGFNEKTGFPRSWQHTPNSASKAGMTENSSALILLVPYGKWIVIQVSPEPCYGHKRSSQTGLVPERKHCGTILCSVQIPSNHCTNKQCYWITQQIIVQLGHTRPSGLQSSLQARRENFEDKYSHMWKANKTKLLLARSIIP